MFDECLMNAHTSTQTPTEHLPSLRGQVPDVADESPRGEDVEEVVSKSLLAAVPKGVGEPRVVLPKRRKR